MNLLLYKYFMYYTTDLYYSKIVPKIILKIEFLIKKY